ncbi:hypothetical protein FMN50_26950 [Rhodobacterales bacterium]|nr:hypothetical protein FMN50_26950 [Rhodobacterales bacterium]
MDLDVLYLADLRFPGGTSTSLKYDLRACRRAGLTAGIIPVASPLFARNRVFNPALLREIEATGTVIVPHGERVRARVGLLYHPTLLDSRVVCRNEFDTDAFYLVVHQTTRDRRGQEIVDTAHWRHIARDWFGHDLRLLPVSRIIRTDLELAGFGDTLHPSDWTNLIDLADFSKAEPAADTSHLIIGRHSRPGPDKWPEPEDALKCYPPSPDYTFRMLGVSQAYLDTLGSVPWNWQVLPFSKEPVGGFLGGLDVYSYFHADWAIESFGYCVLEALASGLPCVLPHYLKPSFGEACFYSTLEDAPEVYERLRLDPALRSEAGNGAKAFAEAGFGLDRFAQKFEEVAEPPRRPRRIADAGHKAARAPVVVTVTSNGVGLGHLSRQIAIARALGPSVNTVFFSLSEAIEIARSMGYLAEFRPFHHRLKLDFESWNTYFLHELHEALNLYEPSLVLFDGNVPYAGFVGAVEAYGRCPSAWIRRGLWRTPQPTTENLDRRFDAVLEPGDLCEAMDLGHAGGDESHVARFDPVVMTQPRHLFNRTTARRALNLPEDAELCLMQLGSEANFDMSLPRQVLLDFLDDHPKMYAVDVRSPLHVDDRQDFHERLLSRKVYPLGQYLKAFDFAVCAAGYNTFHENIAAALPTLFVPNSNPSMDLQEARAEYGARAGWNLTCQASDPYALAERLRQLADPGMRDELASACLGNRECWGGARQIAKQLQVLGQLPVNLMSEF